MKIAIAGTGMIAAEALKALKSVPEIEVRAIFARPGSLEKGNLLASQYSVPEVYTDYGRMLNETDADFIYIGNVNSVHAEYAGKALEAGRNLIMEKPICVSLEQLETIWGTAQRKGLFIFEAVTFLHAPFFSKVREIVGRLGRICSVQCNYSKYSSRYDRYLRGDIAPVFDPACAGGTLLDLNIYSINFLVALFGRPTGEVKYYARKGYNGIDTAGTLVMEYGGFSAVCTAAKDSYSPCFDIVQGEKGYLMIHGSPDNLSRVEFNTGGDTEWLDIADTGHRMVHEFRDFERMYRTGDYGECRRFMDISLAAMDTADKALRSASLDWSRHSPAE